MKTFTSLKDLSTLDLSQVKPVKIVNVVSDSELLEYQKHIQRKAKRFIRKYNGKGIAFGEKEESTITNIGWSQNDIEQELLIETWKLLVSYDPAKAYGANGYCTKQNFILGCLDNKLRMLNTRVWAKKRGYDCPHDYDSVAITGEYANEEE